MIHANVIFLLLFLHVFVPSKALHQAVRVLLARWLRLLELSIQEDVESLSSIAALYFSTIAATIIPP